jgi:HEAT repeat protein
VPALATAAQDGNADVRAAALASLARFGPAGTAAIPVLRQGLEHGDGGTCLLATRALGAIGAEPAVGTLAIALTSPQTEIRLAAAQALGKVGPAAGSAKQALQKALDDLGGTVREAAASALLSIR